MTLIIASKGKDYIVVAADRRGIRADRSHNRIITNIHDKLIKLNEHNCILIAGDGEKGIYITENFKPMVKSTDDVTDILKKFCSYCRKEYEYVHKNVRVELQPDVTFILAGFTNFKKNKPSKPHIYILRSYDLFKEGEQNPYIIEGKRFIAEYLFAKHYTSEMTQKDTIQLVFDCLYDTEKYDGDVGSPYDIKIITELGFNDSVDAAVMKADKDNEESNNKIRKIVEEN